jgi:BASS family bile acid:Na+ symporter
MSAKGQSGLPKGDFLDFVRWRECCMFVSDDIMPVTLQKSLAIPVQALAWLGGHGTRAIAVLVVIGVAVPPIGHAFKPFVTEAIFLLLCISFMRTDSLALRYHRRRPGIILAATAWTALAVPLIFGVCCLATGLDKHSRDLFYIFFGAALTLSPLALGLKLFGLLAGSLFVATAIRWIVGIAVIRKHNRAIDGLNILLMLVFVTAVMGVVAGSFLANPLTVIGLALLAFAVFFTIFGLTVLIFRSIGEKYPLALGLVVSQRNMGLMLAATDGALPGLTWLYFALCQFPIYMSPQLLKPLARTKVEAGCVGTHGEVRGPAE